MSITGPDPTQAWNSPEFKDKASATSLDRAAAMFGEAEKVADQPDNFFAANQAIALYRMYEQRPIRVITAYAGNRNTRSPMTIDAAIGRVGFPISEWNVLRAVVNTAWAVIARSRIRGRMITTEGSGIEKRRAKDGTHWLDGWAEEADLHRVMGAALRDGLVAPFGCVQLYTEGKKVKIQRCLPCEISVDVVGGIYGAPRVWFRQRGVSKASLIKRFGKGKPDLVQQIKDAPILDLDGTDTIADMVLVREAWSLPSTDGAGDGYHAVAIRGPGGDDSSGIGLLCEPWKKNWPPLVLSVWEAGVVGIGGVSLAAQLEPMQVQLNLMMVVERRAQRRMFAPHLFLPNGSKVAKSTITNDPGSIITGNIKPEALNWNALPAEFYQAKADLIAKMYGLSGVSQNVSEGTKPAGTESGAAQREAQESQNLRIQIYAQQSWENPYVEVFRRAVEMAADIAAEDDSGYEVTASTNRGVVKVNLKGVLKDMKAHKVTIYPTGFLPLTPAARLDFILQMLQSQLWDVDRAREALSDLDVESEHTTENAVINVFTQRYEGMLYDGKPAHPNELDVGFYPVAIKQAAVFMAMAEMDKIPKRNMRLLTNYVMELRALQPPPPAPAAPPGAAPQGAPPVPVPVAA